MFMLYDKEANEIIEPYPEGVSKELLIKDCAGKGHNYFCDCNNKVEYKLNKKGVWYPAHQHQDRIHEFSCEKSYRYKQNQKLNKAFKKDGEEDSYIAYIDGIKKDDVSYIKRNRDHQREYPKLYEIPDKLSVPEFFEKYSMLAFERLAKRHDGVHSQFLLTEQMLKKSYYLQDRIYLNKDQKSIQKKYTSKDSEIKIVMEVFKSVNDIVNTNKKGEKYRYLNPSDKYRGIPVKETLLKQASQEFKDNYNMSIKEARKFGDVLLCGFRDKYEMYSIHFIFLNHYGLYCENIYEAQLFDFVCEYINDNNLKEKKIYFYKPWEYGYGAYKDRYLEGGIIGRFGDKKKIILEVFNTNDNESIGKINQKVSMIETQKDRYELVSWYIDEKFPKSRIEELVIW